MSYFTDITQTASQPLLGLLINLILAAIFSFILSCHYIQFGRAMSNRKEFAWVLPFICLTTTLIISIVKSSLALSLGLVGALSIVRFRTPIKEPEELAYLFMSIAVGLGFGADQRIPTLIAIIFILGILTIRSNIAKQSKTQSHFLNIEIPTSQNEENIVKKIDEVLTGHVDVAELRRIDIQNEAALVTYYIDCKDKEKLLEITDLLKKTFPESKISFIQHSHTQLL